MQQVHARGEMDFGFALARPGMSEKKKPGEAGLFEGLFPVSSLCELGDRVRQA